MRGLFFVSVAVVCCSCSAENSEQSRDLAPTNEITRALSEVLEVDLGMGMAITQVTVGRDEHCMWTEMGIEPTTQEGNDPMAAGAERLLESFRIKKEALCGVFRGTDDYRDEVIEQITETRSVPQDQYWFAVFDHVSGDEGEYDLFKSQVVGPFRTRKDCDEAEEVARTADIPTIACRRWSGDLQGPFLVFLL